MLQIDLARKAEAFVQALKKEWEVAEIPAILPSEYSPALELSRIPISDATSLTPAEISLVSQAFRGVHASVALDCGVDEGLSDGIHPLVRLGEQLSTHIPARWPVRNLSDGPDGTVKILDVGKPQDSRSLTALGMAAHQDGWLSLPGVLSVTGLWADSAPAKAAATYSVNVVRLALELRAQDHNAFLSLFSEDAVVVRRTSDGTVVATSPVLYTRHGWTYSFFREPNDEYSVTHGNPDAQGGIEFLSRRVAFGSPGSAFTYLDRPGSALLLNNRHCVHGRTSFSDDKPTGQRRVIASKWWICAPEDRSLVWD